MEERKITNDQFANTDRAFGEACRKAGIKDTKRQASKFRRGFGLAFNTMKEKEKS